MAGGIGTSVDGAVARLVFDNPARHNAISPDMARAALAALEDFAKNPDIRILAVSGAGEKAFVSGADIDSLPEAGAGSGDSAILDMIAALRAFEKPSVALIRGYCYGAGVGVALACDLRLAAPGATFSIPAARLGIAYPVELTHWLVEAIGAPRAKEFLLTGRRYELEEAVGMGLVHKSVDSRDFDQQTATYCRHLAQNAPLSMRAAKAIVNAVSDGLASTDRARCAALIEACAVSRDHGEGRRAFAEKRAPIFTGS